MSLSAEVLALLRCPESGQTLTLAPAGLVQAIRQQHAGGSEFDSGLVRSDREVFYPIVAGIPKLIAAEGIPLDARLQELATDSS